MSVQQVPVKTYKVKPMQPETQEKVSLSLAESADLSERELRCPYCRRYIAALFSDASGHFKTKCGNCKNITTYNVGYFCRVRRCSAVRRKYHQA